MRMYLKALIVLLILTQQLYAAEMFSPLVFNGPYDTAVLFNSLIQKPLNGTGGLSICLVESSMELTKEMLPDGAKIRYALLIWNEQLGEKTLKYGYNVPEKIEVSIAATQESTPYRFAPEIESYTSLSSTSFEFQTAEAAVSTSLEPIVYMTRRIDITADILRYQKENSRASFEGIYTVSRPVSDCVSTTYNSGMYDVSDWAIVLVYEAPALTVQQIYLTPFFSVIHNSTTATPALQVYVRERNEVITLKTVVSEGDVTDFSGSSGNDFKESLTCTLGETTVSLKDSCHQQYADNIDVFNSVSSLYSGGKQRCLSAGSEISFPFFGNIESDTFFIWAADSEMPAYQPLECRFSSGSDMVINSLMITASAATPGSYDVPEDRSPLGSGRELAACTCAGIEAEHLPSDSFYLVLLVQNWGEKPVKKVTAKVKRFSDGCVNYVPGTAEIATIFNGDGDGTDWKPLEADAALAAGNPLPVADTLAPCDYKTGMCSDYRMLRFTMQIGGGCPKMYVFRNGFEIADAEHSGYITNGTRPLTMVFGDDCNDDMPLDPAHCFGTAAVEISDTDTVVYDDGADASEPFDAEDSDAATIDTETKPSTRKNGCALMLL